MGFRPLDHLVAGYKTFNWPRIASLPNAKVAFNQSINQSAQRTLVFYGTSTQDRSICANPPGRITG